VLFQYNAQNPALLMTGPPWCRRLLLP